MLDAPAWGEGWRIRETEEPMTTSTDSTSTDSTDAGRLSATTLTASPLAWDPTPAADQYAENELRRRHERTELMIQKAREQV